MGEFPLQPRSNLLHSTAAKPFSWPNAAFLIGTPLAAALGLVYVVRTAGIAWVDLAIFLAMCLATAFSVTAGYHRLFAHCTYDGHWGVKLFFLIFGAAACENSALLWSSDHRNHHRYVDQPRDPYCIKKGFFWAHMGWIFYQDAPNRSLRNVRDLEKDPWLKWQHRNYWLLTIVAGFVLPTAVGALCGRPLAGFVWGGLVRVVLLHHATFLINSASHCFGTQPYSTQNSARDCGWLAFFTFGEAYHNFHHAYASDYRNGVRWYHWDPSKWLIFSLSRLGLTYHLKRVPKSLLQTNKNRNPMSLSFKTDQVVSA